MNLRWPPTQPALGDGPVVLRAWRPDDAEAVYQACQDEMVRLFTRVPSPYQMSDAVTFVAQGPQVWQARTDVHYAITDTDDEVIGAISLMHIDDQAGEGEIGYWVADWARGNRVARQAIELLGEWALAHLGLARIILMIERENTASIAAALAAGAHPTHVTVDEERRGVLRNLGIYELLAAGS